MIRAGTQDYAAKAHSVKGDKHTLLQGAKLLFGSLPNPAHTKKSDVPSTWEELDHAEEHSAMAHHVSGRHDSDRRDAAVHRHRSRSYG